MRCLAILLAAGLWAALSAAEPPSGWEIGPFARPAEGNPAIAPLRDTVFRNPVDGAPVRWESLHTFNPAAVVRDGKVYVLYRAEDDTGEMRIGLHTSRLGLAESADGIHFTRRPEPVLYPANDSEKEREWPGGCEDPRIVESADGTYVLTYTQWNRRKTDVGIATSRDLVHWTKHGPALGTEGKYGALSYKSAGIVTRLAGGRLVAARIGGRYWMYWGERTVRLATSEDLIHWKPVEDAHGEPVAVLAKRAGRFDSSFPEVGPPPVLTARGIVVIYNGKNEADGAYAAGEALFAADDPSRLIARTDAPVLQPEMPWEKTGQYAAGTTFAEGLVWLGGRWLLYYGAADSLVGVAQVDDLRAGAGHAPAPQEWVAEYPTPTAREERAVTVNGVQEIWQLHWKSAPKAECGADDVDMAITCPCQGFAYGEAGDLELVRMRERIAFDRLSLPPLFGESFDAGKTPAILQRWQPDEKDFEAARFKDFTPTARKRPVVQVMQLGDYDHDGSATEFYIQTEALPCGKSYGVVVGVSKLNARLHAFGTAAAPDKPLHLQKHEWEALRKATGPVDVPDWECGDHGSPERTVVHLFWTVAGIEGKRLRYSCPSGKLIAEEPL